MNVLILVLNKMEYLDDILDGFVKAGVKGATILDSQGMGSAIAGSGQGNQPLFGAIRLFLDNAKPYNKTIFTVIDDEEVLAKAIETVKNILGDINARGVGLMFTLPVHDVYGM